MRLVTSEAEKKICEIDLLARSQRDKGVYAASNLNIDTTTGPSSTTTTPFVVVNTTLKVPGQLLPTVSISEIACEETRTPAAEKTRTARANTGESGVTEATATTNNEWGRHGYIIAEIYKIIATMEPPWGSQCVFEAAARRFPEVNVTALQMTVLAVLMTRRQCIRDLTLAGSRRGVRRDENGEVFIELDLVLANRYSDSY